MTNGKGNGKPLDPKTHNIIGKGNSIMGDTELEADEHPLYQRSVPTAARGFSHENWAYKRAMTYFDEEVIYCSSGTFPRSLYMQNVLAQLQSIGVCQEILEGVCLGFASDYDLRKSAVITPRQLYVGEYIRYYNFAEVKSCPVRLMDQPGKKDWFPSTHEIFLVIHIVNCLQYLLTYRDASHGTGASPIVKFCQAELNALLGPFLGVHVSIELLYPTEQWKERAKFADQ